MYPVSIASHQLYRYPLGLPASILAPLNLFSTQQPEGSFKNLNHSCHSSLQKPLMASYLIQSKSSSWSIRPFMTILCYCPPHTFFSTTLVLSFNYLRNLPASGLWTCWSLCQQPSFSEMSVLALSPLPGHDSNSHQCPPQQHSICVVQHARLSSFPCWIFIHISARLLIYLTMYTSLIWLPTHISSMMAVFVYFTLCCVLSLKW